MILAQGFMDDNFYQVIEGECVVKTHDLSGEERQIDVLGPGEVFGETCFLLGLASNLTVEAQPNTAISCLTRQDIEQFIQTNSEFAASFYKFLAKTIFCRFVKLYKSDQLDQCKVMVAPLAQKKASVRAPFPRSPISTRRRNTASLDLSRCRLDSPAELTAVNSTPSPGGRLRATSFDVAEPEVLDLNDDGSSSETALSPTGKKRSPPSNRRTVARRGISPLRMESE